MNVNKTININLTNLIENNISSYDKENAYYDLIIKEEVTLINNNVKIIININKNINKT